MELRVSLLFIGGIIILAIYLLGRRGLQDDQRHRANSFWPGLWQRLQSILRARASALADTQARHHVSSPPVLEQDELEDLDTIVPERDIGMTQHDEMPVIIELGSEQIAPAGEQLFIPLTIMGKAEMAINGPEILHAVETATLVLKDDGIYRYQAKDTQGYLQPLLGLANILEPGTFSPEQMQEFTTPGLVLYLHLPAPIEAREAFEKLIDVGQKLAELLDADLCDEKRNILTKQTIGHLREKVEAFRFKQKMTQLQRRPS